MVSISGTDLWGQKCWRAHLQGSIELQGMVSSDFGGSAAGVPTCTQTPLQVYPRSSRDR